MDANGLLKVTCAWCWEKIPSADKTAVLLPQKCHQDALIRRSAATLNCDNACKWSN